MAAARLCLDVARGPVRVSAALERRLAALEASHFTLRGRAMLLLPWDVMPEEGEGDMIGCYRIVEPSPDGLKPVEYQRSGIHPRDDVPGSWNRHLYFGEPLNA
jgi:hypothetical protein